MLGQFGLEVPAVGEAGAGPGRAADIAAAYERAAGAVADAVARRFTDETLPAEVPFYGRQVPAGTALELLTRHQAHHRGQMSVLMRQAGVPVPGMYGPAREEWAGMGMQAPD